MVITGGEYIIPQIASSRFCYRAKDDGIVTDVRHNETMSIEYKNGNKATIDILPRKSRTKRAAYISLEMKTLPLGAKFKKNQVIASTKNFDIGNSMYTSGKNINIAIMNYQGFSHNIFVQHHSDMFALIY